ncbi:hypothetical protein [Methylobacterium oryzisoli]|uniref:hypothetical protein n=1 Tax=Methylobacterium oryzisoli TaxID=3385502 RepID=UPI003891B019
MVTHRVGRRTAPALAAVALALLAACATAVDSERARVCRRVLPTLVETGGILRVLRTGPGDLPRSVRVDYVEERPGRSPRTRRAECRFSEMSRTDLAGVVSDGVPVGGASLYLLKRYYLDTPDAAVAEPGAG